MHVVGHYNKSKDTDSFVSCKIGQTLHDNIFDASVLQNGPPIQAGYRHKFRMLFSVSHTKYIVTPVSNLMNGAKIECTSQGILLVSNAHSRRTTPTKAELKTNYWLGWWHV